MSKDSKTLLTVVGVQAEVIDDLKAENKHLSKENEKLKDASYPIVNRESFTPMEELCIRNFNEPAPIHFIDEMTIKYLETKNSDLEQELELVKRQRDEEYSSTVGLDSQIEDLTEKLSDVHEDLRKSVNEKRSLKKKVKELESDLNAEKFINLISDGLIASQGTKINSLEYKISSLESSNSKSDINTPKEEDKALRGYVQELEDFMRI